MQSVLPSSCKCVLGRSAATQRRPQRATRLACRADGSLNTPSSLIGCHSQVWVGGWDKKDIIKSVEGTKNAGFDLIEGIVNQSSRSLPFEIDIRLAREHRYLHLSQVSG